MIVGITRFSVPLSKGVVLGCADNPRAALFNPDRLDAQFALFEAVTLPFMKAEKGIFLILVSAEMPEPWRTRLIDKVGRARKIHIREVEPGVRVPRVIRTFLKQLSEKNRDKYTIAYRLDADDGLPLGHNRILYDYRESGAQVIAHRNGIFVRWHNGLQIADVADETIAAGTAFVSQEPKEPRSLFTGHAKWTREYPSLILNDKASWLRTIHGKTDSARAREDVRWRAFEGTQRELFAARFPYIDVDALTAALKLAPAKAPVPKPAAVSVARPAAIAKPPAPPPTFLRRVRRYVKRRTGL
jgi:hypothetical protein